MLPSVCLMMFDTNNKFKLESRLKHLNYIYTNSENKGIKVLKNSADGNCHLLHTHWMQSELGLLTPDLSQLSSNLQLNLFSIFHAYIYFQKIHPFLFNTLRTLRWNLKINFLSLSYSCYLVTFFIVQALGRLCVQIGVERWKLCNPM